VATDRRTAADEGGRELTGPLFDEPAPLRVGTAYMKHAPEASFVEDAARVAASIAAGLDVSMDGAVRPVVQPKRFRPVAARSIVLPGAWLALSCNWW